MSEPIPELAPEVESARACMKFYDALQAEGFSDEAAVTIVAAWMGRPVIDMAGYNGVIQNMIEAMMGA